MPCEYGASLPIGSNDKANKKLIKKLDKLTRMLCTICNKLPIVPSEHSCNIIESVPGLRKWWSKHQKDDLKRKKK